jgi:hypothetical protein
VTTGNRERGLGPGRDQALVVDVVGGSYRLRDRDVARPSRDG